MSTQENTALRAIPSVESLLRDPTLERQSESLPHPVVVELVRSVVDSVRSEVRKTRKAPDREEIIAKVGRLLALYTAGRPARIINATGVILHTNLGRAVLGERIGKRLAEVARGYSDLEFDVIGGKRGKREAQIELMVRVIAGAEAGLVVNNCAAAVLLSLETLAKGRDVVVSRGELVEIGGSFRIPDVLAKSGARMIEVGTTNKTRLADYRNAITSETAVLLKVHTSNFRIRGFTETASTEELAALAAEHGIILVRDLGSGATGLAGSPVPVDEPTLAQEIRAGADVVAASGDKLLGGPQAGILVGRREVIRRLASNPLYRALRPGKLTLAALSETLLAHLEGNPQESLPALRMLGMDEKLLDAEARSIAERMQKAAGGLATIECRPGGSETGGGSIPDTLLETTLVSVTPARAPVHVVERRLRMDHPIVMVRVQEGRILIDPRTLMPGEDDRLIERMVEALAQEGEAA